MIKKLLTLLFLTFAFTVATTANCHADEKGKAFKEMGFSGGGYTPLPNVEIRFRYGTYTAGGLGMGGVKLTGPVELKGKTFDITVSGAGQSITFPLMISPNKEENFSLIFFQMPDQPNSEEEFKASITTEDGIVSDTTTVSVVLSEYYGDDDFELTPIALDSVTTAIRQAMAMAHYDPQGALAILTPLVGTSVYTGKTKVLIDGTIQLANLYQRQGVSAQKPAIYRISADLMMKISKKFNSNLVSAWIDAMGRGVVPPKGDIGIKTYAGSGLRHANGTIYRYGIKQKVVAHFRLYGNAVDTGDRHIILFTAYGKE